LLRLVLGVSSESLIAARQACQLLLLLLQRLVLLYELLARQRCER
jgi:hypothetical protein